MRTFKQLVWASIIGVVALMSAQGAVAGRYYDRHDRYDNGAAVGAAVVLGLAALVAYDRYDRRHDRRHRHYYRDHGYRSYGYRDYGYRDYRHGYRDGRRHRRHHHRYGW